MTTSRDVAKVATNRKKKAPGDPPLPPGTPDDTVLPYGTNSMDQRDLGLNDPMAVQPGMGPSPIQPSDPNVDRGPNPFMMQNNAGQLLSLLAALIGGQQDSNPYGGNIEPRHAAPAPSQQALQNIRERPDRGRFGNIPNENVQPNDLPLDTAVPRPGQPVQGTPLPSFNPMRRSSGMRAV